MAFEKAKVLKAAEKFLSQGKINAAIKEYRQIVDNDVDDLTTLNMLGDLYVRASKKEEAIKCFDRIAEHYRTQEFNLKAIAMYKKIDRLRPRDPSVANKLADLYASQGLIVDARAQYLIVADAYTRGGDNRRALDILHRIADLDPNNVDIRLKLAEGYVKESMRTEAALAFVQAANRLQQVASIDRSLEAYSKALQLIPDDVDALRGLLESHIARGTPDEAAEVLEKVVETRDSDKELVSMLARAHLEAEDPAGAERAVMLLMKQDSSNYPQILPVARLYLKNDEVDETLRVLEGIIERMLAGREERELLELVNSVLERDPDRVPALRMLVRIYWWQRDMDSLRSALERLAEAAEAAELVDEERYALTQLVRLAPDEPRYLDRLNLIGGLQEETVEDFTAQSEPEPEPPRSDDVPQFETFAVVDTDEDVATPVEVVQFETNAGPAQAVSDPTSSFADLNDDQAFASEVDSKAERFQEVSFADLSVAADEETEPSDVVPDRARQENMMRQELESVDFYIAQGYADIAIDTLEMLERQFGSHPEIEVRRAKLAEGQKAAGEAPAVFEFGGAEESNNAQAKDPGLAFSFTSHTAESNTAASPTSASASAPAPAAKGIDSGLAELFEEFRTAEEDDLGHEDYETHYNMGTAYKEMDLVDEAIQEFQTSVALVKPGDGTSRFLQCCNMLGHCFLEKGMPEAAIMWFKKGLAAPGHTEDEYQALRYELALAYEESGDLTNAQQLYTEVYGVDVSYREVGDKLSLLKKKMQESR
ncbi:MAG TPA: tetratricopeptide repeat protein [Pyrinomonadaceae bacterium]|nr:tetratricopeptide repeat protein [Pyrinomonadaceae bacterium]